MLHPHIILFMALGSLVCLITCFAAPATAGNKNTAAEFVAEQLAKGKKTNSLIHEKSPYLLQHAFQPVNWLPWSDEAFTRAREENKPVFLSVGYSTCHWCHVMAHESFEDPEIAAYLNSHFICIKVDREERPDVDQIYMAATQAMTGGGGWPMSVFLLHDRKPFYSGTYFPPRSIHGRPGFLDLLQSIQRAWTTDKTKLIDSAAAITDHLRQMANNEETGDRPDKTLLEKAWQQTAASYDRTYGGFGTAPKFPRPVLFDFLLRYSVLADKNEALEMTLTTLRRMAAGGMCDQLGGGFHRYSVDEQWRVPHFEKMLYDQAQLAVSFLEAFQISREPLFRHVAKNILDYILNNMTAAEGGFYSAEDADSTDPENPARHGEGLFYLWTEKEIHTILGDDGATFNFFYGVRTPGNALHDPMEEFQGKNILYQAQTNDETAVRFGKSVEEIDEILEKSRKKLLQVRDARPRPHLDDKIITAWNGLMISAFARGAQILASPQYLEAAEKAASFVMENLFDPQTETLFRRFRDGEAKGAGQLDDYAFLVQGLLDLYEASQEIHWLQQASDLTAIQIKLLADKEHGGFFTTPETGKLPVRMKEDYDGAEPAGNSVAALNLLRLAWMTGQNDWRLLGEKTITTFGSRISDYPSAMPKMLTALAFQLSKPRQIIIAGDPQAEDTQKLVSTVQDFFIPHKILLFADNGPGQAWLSTQLPVINDLTMVEDKATAYVCENFTCRLPVTDPDKLHTLLQ